MNGFGGYLKAETITILGYMDDLKSKVRLDATLQQPKSVVEAHSGLWCNL